MPGYIFILVLLVLLWFLLIRPQRRRQLEAQRRLLVYRRARQCQERNADEGREDEREQREMSAPI